MREPRPGPGIGRELTVPQQLACALRIIGDEGWSENLDGHISWATPDGGMWMNPWGIWWDEVRASQIIRLDADGNVAEGPGYNVFALVDGALLTPEAGVLEGITRLTVIELAREHGIPVHEIRLDEATFRSGTELFATSTAGGVMAITSLDGRPVGDGAVGPVTQRLRDLYWAAHADPRYTTPIDY